MRGGRPPQPGIIVDVVVLANVLDRRGSLLKGLYGYYEGYPHVIVAADTEGCTGIDANLLLAQ